jgi:hypothetical protein
MKHVITLFCLTAIFAVNCGITWAADSPTSKKDDGYIEPFNGKDFDGWVIEGNKTYKVGDEEKPVWSVEDGMIRIARHKGFGFLRYDEELADFELKLEYRQQTKSNSGIGIRYDKFTGTAKSRPSFAGYEIQLLDDGAKDPNEHSTGSLYRYVAPTKSAAKPAGEWNELSITCRGPKIKIVLNGQVIQDVDQSKVPEIAKKPLKGHISLQNHGGGADFRAIKLKKLESAAGS